MREGPDNKQRGELETTVNYVGRTWKQLQEMSIDRIRDNGTSCLKPGNKIASVFFSQLL